MLDVRRLRLLREVQIRGTLAEVATALNFSPSSVSQQLTLLEQETGVELLRKVGRRVQLTPQAEILVEHTAALLDVLERAEADLTASLATVSGTVRVAVFQSAALALMPAALTSMRREYPDVRIEMVQREPETALRETWARDFDMVVAEQYPAHAAPHHPGLDKVDLTTDAIRLAVPPRGIPSDLRGSASESRGASSDLRGASLDMADVTSIADARHLPWVMEPHGAASRHFAEQMCRAAGFEPDVRFQTADLQAQIRLIASGNAVGLMPDLVWAGGESNCRLVELPEKPRRTIFTSVRRSGTRYPAVSAFRSALEAAAALIDDTPLG